MSNTERLRKKLFSKLTELFQLDQPDLDFGFYRIMHAKGEQVKQFINNDLLEIIKNAFGQVDEARKTELKAAYDKAIETAKSFGVSNPEESEPVKKAKAALDALKDGVTAEADVYDHLYRFFERYYDEGDFISRRYYTRENSGKAAPFAIPYNGEEVKLHWANADQYYIKTTEYFSNYTFDLVQAAEFRNMNERDKVINNIPETPLKVHFRIVDATEGEHGNIKTSDDKKRFFILHDNKPVEINEAGELVVNFEYKSLPDGNNAVDSDTEAILKSSYSNGKIINKGDLPNLSIAHKIITCLETLNINSNYKSLSAFPAPTEKIPARPLLAKYINQYTARNTSDYFIHKNLGGFLKRELDFYIKNEVMNLDDVENADAPAVESYLAKVKVIRKIAAKLIEFLAQLEDFQKKLWLKKKFVVETNYCITLDRVPEELYPEIAVNDAQIKEWVNLFAIDEIKAGDGDLLNAGNPAYSNPLTIEFLKANDKLVLDTRFFGDEFKAKLIENIEDFDEQCDGLLIHSENFQALNLLQERYREQVKCVYIDPPYNTKKKDFTYKDGYKNSSWLSFIFDRIVISINLISTTSSFFCNIDENELYNLHILLIMIFGEENFIADWVWQNKKGGGNDSKFVAVEHEYIKCFVKNQILAAPFFQPYSKKYLTRYKEQDTLGQFYWDTFKRKSGKQYYPITCPDGTVLEYDELGNPISWLRSEDRFKADVEIGDIKFEKKTEGWSIFFKQRLPEGKKPRSILSDIGTTGSGNDEQLAFFAKILFSNPKPSSLVNEIISYPADNTIILDYFAGSGTTGHAVINLNREDDGNRKYILVEMGDHFNTVLKPRISKVVYSESWKDGKPTNCNTGISHCFKYLRLESYEDTLNNLRFEENTTRDKILEQNDSLRQDYMLHYMLDVETRGSNSLLNIDAFADPMNYTLKIKKPATDQQVICKVDLVETFNYLIGLRVQHIAATQNFTADFIRKPDPELPEDQHTKLLVDGKISQTANGRWWFKKIEGWIPSDPLNPNNGQKEKILIVWRNLTGDIEKDNLMLDEWFQKYRISTRDFEYDTIYVNGSNNLPNLKKDDENWKVRLIEEEFHRRMWETGGDA